MRLVYLTRGEKGIKVEYKKPPGVRVSQNHTLWFLREFSYPIGEKVQQFHYNDLEVIGVFDLDKPKHLNRMMEVFEAHLRQHFEKAILATIDIILPVRKDNMPPPTGPGGFHFTSVGSAIAKVFRHGNEHGDW